MQDGATEEERPPYEARVEYDAGTESDGERDSQAECVTLKEEADTQAGDLALEHEEDWSCDSCDNEE